MTNQEDTKFRGRGLSLAWRDSGHQCLLSQGIHNTNLLGKDHVNNDMSKKSYRNFLEEKWPNCQFIHSPLE